MIISARQMAAMLEANRQSYVQNYRPLMRREFPEFWTRFDEAQIEQILMDQCAFAGRHSLQSGRAAYLLFTLRIRLGRDFPDGEAFGWARAILKRPGHTESERLDALEARVWGAAA
jgi:hypothetical protein